MARFGTDHRFSNQSCTTDFGLIASIIMIVQRAQRCRPLHAIGIGNGMSKPARFYAPAASVQIGKVRIDTVADQLGFRFLRCCSLIPVRIDQ